MSAIKKGKSRLQDLRNGISIRWKLATYMAVFVAFVLLITWLFQVFLLDNFFQYVKRREMEETTSELALLLDDEEALRSYCYEAAIDHSLCVMIYRIEGQSAEKLTEIDATGNNVIMTLHPKRLEYFYKRAQDNGGEYFSSTVGAGGLEVPGEDFFDRLPFGGDEDTVVADRNLRMMYVRLIDAEEAESDLHYMILIDTNHQPLGSTVRTLTTQFLCIAAIILMLAGVTVFLLYRKISAPLIRMNESAKQLARGRYDAEFVGEGYRETHELAETLNYAAGELSKLDNLQKELIANISHDLRTPLTMIKGYSEVMRDLPGENTPENVQVIIDETSRLSELVTDLLDLSRLQAGMQVPDISCFNLTLAVREVMDRYETLVKHKGYRVEFRAQEDVFVNADRQMILQVLYNLINNAINYTGEDKTVTVRQLLTDGGRVRISVTDSGEGISPEDIPMIWDRYYKVDKVHRRAMIGTGLGLSIVKGILVLHRAPYGVNSRVGHGSTFWFELDPILPALNEKNTADTEL